MLSTEGVELRIERLTALQRVEAQLNEKRMENLPSVSRAQGHPRSANLEQLYHEAIPMDKALSHSGPSAFGNGLLQHPVSQFILTDSFLLFLRYSSVSNCRRVWNKRRGANFH